MDNHRIDKYLIHKEINMSISHLELHTDEAYLGDMVKPLKVLLPEFAVLEDKVSAIIAATYGLDFSDYAPIKRADLIALATEKRDLMPHSAERWAYLDGIAPLPGIIEAMGPAEAKQRFLHAFAQLSGLGLAA